MVDDPIARPTPPERLVDYQAGSVVSRVLLRNAGGVVTVFAFAEGEGLSEHSTPHDAIVQLLEGRARIVVGGDEHVVGAGEVLRLPRGVPHSLEGGEPFKMLLTILKFAKAG